MRKFVLGAASAAIFSLGFGAAAQTSLIGQADTAFQGGVYATLSADAAAGCAQLCAEDNICLAWTYREAKSGSCELKAVVPRAISETGAISGFSRRAPDFARRLAEAPAAERAVAAKAEPAAPPVDPTIPIATAPRAAAAPSQGHVAPEDMLLGAPADAASLRPRIPEEPPG